MGKAESESRNTTGTEKDQLTVAEAGRRGGNMTRDRHGVKFLRKIAQKGGRVTATRYRDLLAEFGRKGGRPRRPSLNKPVGEKTGKKGGQRRSARGFSPPAKIITRLLWTDTSGAVG